MNNWKGPRGFTEAEWREIIKANETAMYPSMADKFKAVEVRAEHQRLKDAVVDAARAAWKAESKSDTDTYAQSFDNLLRQQRAFRAAALIDFETEHGIDNQQT